MSENDKVVKEIQVGQPMPDKNYKYTLAEMWKIIEALTWKNNIKY